MHTNGVATHTNNPPAPAEALSLEQIREQTKQLRIANRLKSAQLEKQQLDHQAKLLEAYGGGWFDAQGFGGSDWVWQRVRDQYGAGGPPITTPTDRRGGAEWPLWRTEPELSRMRQAARLLVRENSYAKGLLKNLTNIVIGVGFSYKFVVDREACLRHGVTVQTEDGPAVDDETAEKLRVAIEGIGKEFLERNHWTASAMLSLDIDTEVDDGAGASMEREMYRRVQRDGEAFVRFTFEDDGGTVVRFVDPELVRQPPGKTFERGWSYGIKWTVYDESDERDFAADESDVNRGAEDLVRRRAFFVARHDMSLASAPVMDRPLGVIVPATHMIQVMSEEQDAEVMRGTPLFSYGTMLALVRAERLQHNMSVTSSEQAATAEIWKHAFGTAAQIQQMPTGLATKTSFPPVIGPWTGNSFTYQSGPPGRIRRIPEGQEPVAFPQTREKSEFLAVAQGDLRQAGVAFAVPEYMISGDASNNSYSSSVEAGTPFVRNGLSEQEHYKRACRKCVARAVKHGVRARGIPEIALKVIKLQIEGTQIEKDDALQKAQVNAVEHQNGVLSVRTWQMQLGLDPKVENQNFREEREAQGPQLGELPMPGEPGAPEAGGMPGKPAMESLLEAKDASGHEHASDTGQFTAGNGGEKKERHSDATSGGKSRDAGKIVNHPRPQGHKDWEKIVANYTDDEAKIVADHIIDHMTEPDDDSFGRQVEYMARQEASRKLEKRPEAKRMMAAMDLIQSERANERGQAKRKQSEAVGTGLGASAGHHVSSDDQDHGWEIAQALATEAIAHRARVAESMESLTTAVRAVLESENLLYQCGLREGAETSTTAPVMEAEPLSAVFPDVRQPNNYACGAACFTAAAQFRGVTMEVGQAEKLLGTSVAKSTNPKRIVEGLHGLGIAADPREGMTIADLQRETDAGKPVIVCIQDYGSRREAGASFLYGHYVTILQVVPGLVIAHDPSIENVEREPGGDVPRAQADASGNQAAPGLVPFRQADFERIWHDQDEDGNKLVRFGIVVGPRTGGVQESWLMEAVVNGNGIDKLGRKWAGGKLVKKDAPDTNDKAAKAAAQSAEKNKKAAEKGLASAEKKHARQLSVVKTAEKGLAKAKTAKGKASAQKRIDAAQAKADITEKALHAAKAAHASATSGHAGQGKAAPAAPKKTAAAQADPHAVGRAAVRKWENASPTELNKVSALAEHLKDFPHLASVTEAKDYALKTLKLDDATLGDDMAVNNQALAALAALKNMGFRMPRTIETTAFSSHGLGGIGSSGEGHIRMNKTKFLQACRGQVANQEAGEAPRWLTTNDPNHFVVHEVGHWLHEVGGGYRDKTAKEAKFQAVKATLSDVSEYGKADHREFVAEVFTGLVLGRKFSGPTMALYKEFGGPQSRRWSK